MDKVLQGDAVEVLSEMRQNSVQTCVTSPPYFNLRDYGVEGQLGTEDSVEEYVENLVQVFRGVRCHPRALRRDGIRPGTGQVYASLRSPERRDRLESLRHGAPPIFE